MAKAASSSSWVALSVSSMGGSVITLAPVTHWTSWARIWVRVF